MLMFDAGRSVQLWDVAQRRLRWRVMDHSEMVTAFAWVRGALASEGAFVSGSVDKSIRYYRHARCLATLTAHQGMLTVSQSPMSVSSCSWWPCRLAALHRVLIVG